MKIYLSPLAQQQLPVLMDYLEENRPPKVRDNFLDKLDASLSVIAAQPEAFPASQKMPGLRRCIITPQTIPYYRIQQNEIEVVALNDARRDIGLP